MQIQRYPKRKLTSFQNIRDKEEDEFSVFQEDMKIDGYLMATIYESRFDDGFLQDIKSKTKGIKVQNIAIAIELRKVEPMKADLLQQISESDLQSTSSVQTGY